MNITTKIIITDTNIITDLDNANLLEDFIKLDNVYISDMVKNDEINFKTGEIKLINKLKIMEATPIQLLEISLISSAEKQLSTCDILNYIIARDNNCILATGDNRLKTFAEKNGVEVIRTLKVISLMAKHNYISIDKAIKGSKLLKENVKTRIPLKDIDKIIKELEEILITS